MNVTFRQLRGFAEVTAQDSMIRAAEGTRAAIASLFASRNVEPSITMEMSSNESIKQAVMAGMGLAFLSLGTTR